MRHLGLLNRLSLRRICYHNRDDRTEVETALTSISISICLSIYMYICISVLGFPGSSVAKNPPLIPGSGRSPGEGNGNPLQYSCLGNSMDRGYRAYQAIVQGGHKNVRHDSMTQFSSVQFSSSVMSNSL